MTEKPWAFQDASRCRKPIAMDLSREGAPVAFASPDREGALWAMEGISGWDAVDEVGRCLKEAGYGPYEIVRNRAECPLCGTSPGRRHEGHPAPSARPSAPRAH